MLGLTITKDEGTTRIIKKKREKRKKKEDKRKKKKEKRKKKKERRKKKKEKRKKEKRKEGRENKKEANLPGYVPILMDIPTLLPSVGGWFFCARCY